MKSFISTILIVALAQSAAAQQYVWSQKTSFGGGTRYAAIGFSIGQKGYLGSGITHVGSNYTYYQDFWEYDPLSNAWTQVASLPGAGRSSASGFAIGSKGYVTIGWSPSALVDTWEYDPAANSWTQKANFGGSGRYDAATFTVGNYAFVGCGHAPPKNDFWKYDPVNDSWTQMANAGGNPRSACKGFAVGNFGYVIGGGVQFSFYSDDLWRYNPASNTWSQMTSMPGGGRTGPAAFSINGFGFVGLGNTHQVVYDDFYIYDPVADIWSAIPQYPGNGRIHNVAFSIGNCAYVGTGADSTYPSGIDQSDFWCLCDVTGIDENGAVSRAGTIFPNPVTGPFEISLNEPVSGDLLVQIISTTGSLVFSASIHANHGRLIVPVDPLASGTYFCSVFRNNQERLFTGNLMVR